MLHKLHLKEQEHSYVKKNKLQGLTASQTNEQIMIIRYTETSKCFLFQSQAYK